MKHIASYLARYLFLFNGLLIVAGAASGQAAEPNEPTAPNRRIDDRRPAAPARISLWGTPVELTGSWEYSDERRDNFDLNRARDRDRRVREHELKLEVRALLTGDVTLFLQAVGLHETRRTQGTAGAQRTQALERGQAWVQFNRLAGTPWTMQIGRVPLLERRSWWWDDDLDGARLRYTAGPWRLDSGVGGTLARLSSADDATRPEARGVWRHWGQAGWQWEARQLLEAFWLLQADRSGAPLAGTPWLGTADPDSSDLRARWAGLRASGEWRSNRRDALNYWLDSAVLRGRETLTAFAQTGDAPALAGATTQRRVRGQAFDGGATLSLALPLRPALTLAYAHGSGGPGSATLDANFRQTGLHENKARLSGVKRLRRYGELLQPDLSNLKVASVGLGVRLLDNSSLEAVWHQYRQVHAATSLAGSRLAQSPLGLNPHIGHETDVFLALREWRWLELTLRVSRFMPGAAFAANRRDPAHALELGLAVNF